MNIPLPRWATITQVSRALGIPRPLVRTVVRRATATHDPWVMFDPTSGKTRSLIDTSHPTYSSYAHQWKPETHVLAPSAPSASLVPFDPSESEVLACDEEQVADGLQAVPLLRQWLSTVDLAIFKNVLDEGAIFPWHWRWGSQHDESYASIEEALVAALQCRLIEQEDNEARQSDRRRHHSWLRSLFFWKRGMH
jgi:hypothetical protein